MLSHLQQPLLDGDENVVDSNTEEAQEDVVSNDASSVNSLNNSLNFTGESPVKLVI